MEEDILGQRTVVISYNADSTENKIVFSHAKGEDYTYTTDNWFFHTSTNKHPYDLNMKKGEKIPFSIKTPKQVSDNH